jgi:hypothetical protein
MRAIIFRLSIGIQILIGNQISYGQVSSDSLRTDSIDVITGVANYLDVYNTKWMTIGSQYDFLSSAFGLLISNGFDERPLIHFEDFSENLIFKIRGSTDFIKDYSIGTDFGWKYPIRHLAIISLGFDQYNYSRKEFYHHDFNVTAENFITKLDIALRLKIAYQTLNDFKNVGTTLGIRKVILYRKLYSGLSVGYYFDYFTYSANIQGFVYKNLIGIRLNYERIDKFDFFNVGMIFTFNR